MVDAHGQGDARCLYAGRGTSGQAARVTDAQPQGVHSVAVVECRLNEHR